ncbi:MAG: sugar ABC transporter permease, partial [Actinomycetota bacterium]|nr:sugar ABC transporter permease [Actinomycetota bacterium]
RRGGGAARLTPYLLVTPSVVALVALFAYPVYLVVKISLQQFRRRELIPGRTADYNNFENYRSVLTDDFFWSVTTRSFVFTFACVAATMLIGTALAFLLHRLGTVMRLGLSVAMVLAWSIPILTNVVLWLWMFDPRYGVINHLLTRVGFESYENHNWLQTQTSVFFVIGVIIVWQALPFVAFSVQAGLASLPKELHEAARVDGAGAWRAFSSITWPILKPVFLILTFLSFIWDFRAFAQIWVVRNGGPGTETVTLPVYLYTQGVAKGQFGVAAAVSVLMILLLSLALAYYIRLLLKTEDV